MPNSRNMNLAEIQEQLRAHGLDGWLFFDHHHRDPIAYRVLKLDPKLHATRRWYYWIPAVGEPIKLVHRIENWNLDSLPGSKQVYSAWKEQHEKLAALLEGASRLAMQYSPQCMIPYVSLVDAGTVDLLRSLDKEIVSSASLVQYFEARWSAEQLETHLQAGRLVDATRRQAFREIGRRIQADGAVQESPSRSSSVRGSTSRGLSLTTVPSSPLMPTAATPTTPRPPSKVRRSVRATSY